ncbi:MAG: hypothetical protein ACRYF5_07350, partial [Janthinobacterium lividum]
MPHLLHLLHLLHVLRLLLLPLLVLALLLASMQPAAAHDMPNEVRVHVLIKPEGNRLAVLVRIPLEI